MTVPSAVEVAVARIRNTQARCGTRLCQVDLQIESSRFGAIQDVDVHYLVWDALDALSAAGYVLVRPQDKESMRAAGFQQMRISPAIGQTVWIAPEMSTE